MVGLANLCLVFDGRVAQGNFGVQAMKIKKIIQERKKKERDFRK